MESEKFYYCWVADACAYLINNFSAAILITNIFTVLIFLLNFQFYIRKKGIYLQI